VIVFPFKGGEVLMPAPEDQKRKQFHEAEDRVKRAALRRGAAIQ
jgi:hypothetical protein